MTIQTPEQPIATSEPTVAGEETTTPVAGATSLDRLRAAVGRLPVITLAAAIFVMGGLALLAVSLSGGGQRPMLPLLPTFTPLAGTAGYAPVEVGFTELNADPVAYLGQRLQVSGAYTPLAQPECPTPTGPALEWSLVADELQLNALGFETVLRLIEADTPLTVTGVWRAYRGPLGCGKEPPDGTVWYLEVEQIIEPNPLLGASGPLLTVIAGTPATLSAEETAESTPTPGVSTPTAEEVGTIPATLPGGAPTAAMSPTPTLLTTPLVTAPPTTPLATAATPGGTPGAGTPALSPTFGPSPTPTATGGPGGTTTPGLPTSTPGGPGYPGQATPTPTGTTTGGYP
jgi:hypothetical protein